MTEPTASMQERLARRDHRIAVLEAICAAQTFRLTVLQAREGGFGAPVAASPELVDSPHSIALSRAMSAPEMQIGHSRR